MAMVRLKAKEGAGGASWNGQWFPLVDGHVTVPEEAVVDLTHFLHGFTVARDAPPAPKIAQPRGVRHG